MTTPMYDPQSSVNPGGIVNPPTPANPIDDIDAKVQAVIDAKLNAVESKYQQKIADLENTIKGLQRGVEAAGVPFNGGGPGTETVQVWSQYHQELANSGRLTDEHLANVRGQ